MAHEEALKQCTLFQDFTPTGLGIVGGIVHELNVPANTPIFVEGMLGSSMFVLVGGAVRLTRKTKSGEVTLAKLGPGDHFGDLSLVQTGPRMISAVAEEPSQLLELSYKDFAALQQSKPQACVKLMLNIARSMAGRLREAHEVMNAFVQWSVEG